MRQRDSSTEVPHRPGAWCFVSSHRSPGSGAAGRRNLPFSGRYKTALSQSIQGPVQYHSDDDDFPLLCINMKLFSRHPQNVQGVLCLVGALVFLTISDSIIKWLSPFYPLHEITLYRATVALGLVLVFVHFTGGLTTLRTHRPGLHLFRGFLLVLANMFFFLGLSVMPLAEVVALFFVGPFFICLLARPFLGEVVGWQRWLAIAVGLIGVLVLVEPGGSEFTWTTLLPILAALAYSSMVVVTRKLGMNDSAGTLTFYIQVAFILVSVASGLLLGDGRYNLFSQPTLDFLLRAWRWPGGFDLLLLFACGAVVAAGGYLMSQSYRIAQVSVVAPFEYTSLPLAVVVGYLIWGDLPGLRDYIGSALIIGSGIWVIWSNHEHSIESTGPRSQDQNALGRIPARPGTQKAP